ncbi:hydrogenase subunit MbhD domain-containing protein [Chloroflexota bacterium]
MEINAVDIVLFVTAIISAILAVRFNNLLFAAISLATLSAILAIVFYQFNSPYAAIFELSVCAGLITALFVSAISLTRRT